MKKEKTRKAFVDLGNLLPLTATVGLVGGMMNMLFGNEKTSKRDIAKGVLDLVCDDYENTIREMEIINNKQENKIEQLKKEIEQLKLEIGIVEDTLRKQTKKKKKSVKRKKK